MNSEINKLLVDLIRRIAGMRQIRVLLALQVPSFKGSRKRSSLLVLSNQNFMRREPL